MEVRVHGLGDLARLMALVCMVCNVLLAIWIFTDIRKRGEGSGIFVALAPAGARFESGAAQPPDDGVNAPNPGMSILMVNTTVPASGDLTVEIELAPGGLPAGR